MISVQSLLSTSRSKNRKDSGSILFFDTENTVFPKAIPMDMEHIVDSEFNCIPSAIAICEHFAEMDLDISETPKIRISAIDFEFNSELDITGDIVIDPNCCDKNFEYPFTDTNTAVVLHELGKKPAVTVIDEDGNELKTKVDYDSLDQVTVTWNGIRSGTVICN